MSAPAVVKAFLGSAEVIVPALEIDARLARMRSQDKVRLNARGRLERRLVAALIQSLDAAGYMVAALDGCDEGRVALVDRSGPNDAEALKKMAMELVFNLDDSWIVFQKKGDPESEHAVSIVLGNGLDLVSDWRYATRDGKEFNALLQSFVDGIEELA